MEPMDTLHALESIVPIAINTVLRSTGPAFQKLSGRR